jgi:hypothetical protein
MPCHHCRKARTAARQAINAALDGRVKDAASKAIEAAKAVRDKMKGKRNGEDNRND